MRAAALMLVPLALAACGPETLAQAESNCAQEARLAERPRGEGYVGFGSGGTRRAGLGIEISSDYLAGRDPEKVWQSCVHRRSGQIPSRSYNTLPEDWGRTGPMRRG